MGLERRLIGEQMRPTPNSVCIVPHLSLVGGGIGDQVIMATIAANLKDAGLKKVAVAHKNNTYQKQVAQLVRSDLVNFIPVPQGIFDDKLLIFMRMVGYLSSLPTQAHFLSYERIALIGAKEMRYFMKPPHKSHVDVFPDDLKNQSSHQRIADYYYQRLRGVYNLAARPNLKPVRLTIPQRFQDVIEKWAKRENLELNKPFWLINLSTGNPSKNWPVNNFFNIARWLQQNFHTPVVMFNPSVSDKDQVANFLSNQPQTYFFTSSHIAELSYLIKKALGYIGGDTGMTHIAAALGTSFVTVFPNGNLPAWQPITANQPHQILSAESVLEITPEQVMAAIISLHS